MLSFLLVLLLYFSRQKAFKKLLEKNNEIISTEKKISIKSKQDSKSHTEGNEFYSKEELESFEKIIALINEQEIYLQPDLTLTMLASKFNITTNKLSIIIKTVCESNYSDFINTGRIKYAQKLLLDSEYTKFSISGIAKMSGYISITTFNAAFKKHTGLTPSYYRKNV